MPGPLNAQGPDTHSPRMRMAMRPRIRRTFLKLKSLLHHEKGSSVIELALVLPLLGAGVLLIGAVGIQLKHYIHAHQILRAGVAAAMHDPGPDAVLQQMRDVATGKGYTVRTQPGSVPGEITLTSRKECICPYTLTYIDCSSVCPAQRPATVLYVLTAYYRDAEAARSFAAAVDLLRGGGGLADVLLRTQVMIR